MENIKEQLEEVIKKIILSKEIDVINQKNQSSDALSMSHGYNQALSQINPSLMADEVLKVVVEKITKDILDEIEQYIVSAKAIKINKQQADFVYWYDVKLAIKRLLSNLSTNKENKK